MKDVVLMEASSKKSTYKKKYKCPYCDIRLERPKLVQHVQNKHAELIPEGYTALRVVFNSINKTTGSKCIVCGKDTPWNEIKGRYERLCGSEECRRAYEKIIRERTKKKYGTDNMQGDPRYAAEIQKKALANRSISGEYQFSDGGKIMYVGSYEKKFLEFMDIVMKVNSEDILSPGPEMYYMYNGKKHLYLPDFYYIPYNLLIEIKDGKDSNNTNAEYHKDNDGKNKAKEKAVIDSGKFNYVKITNNDFSQLVSMFGVLKYQMINDCYDPVIRINESVLLEVIDKVSLSSFTRIKISDKSINDYKSEAKYLKHFRTGKDYKGYIYINKDSVVCGLNVNIETGLIQAIEISEKYQGMGLSYQILDVCCKELHATHLTVRKNNKIAIHVYEKYGFEIYKEDENSYYMKLKGTNIQSIVTESDIEIVKELFNRDDVESIEDISESELQAFYKVAGLDESGTLNELFIVEADDSGNFMTDPLYVVLMDLNMIRNKVIKAYTHSQWSHSAISFDSSLDEMYSYANERDENNKVLRTGFTRENKRSYLKLNPKCKTKLFALFITPVQMENVKKLVDYYLNNMSKTAYNMFSIISIVVHKVLKRAINDPLKMVCSQFVYTILLAAQITSTITKNTALVTPEDINSKLLDDRLFTIYDGLLKDYNQKEVDKLTKKAYKALMKKNMREATIEEQQAITSNIDKISKPTGINFWDFFNEMDESMSGAIGAALPLTPEPRPYESNEDNYYIVQHLQNNVYDYSITKDPTQYTMYSLDPEKGYRVYKSENIDKNYITFKMKDSKKAKEVYKEIYDSFGKSIENATPDYVYYRYTGNHILTEDQLLYDDRLELVPNFKDQIQEMCDSFYREFCPDDMDKLDNQLKDLKEVIYHE